MKSYRVLALGWILALTLLHLWMIGSGRWPLSGDEAHYWEWSRRLDWSYYSKGPLVAYLIALSTRLGAHTEFWVRLPAVLLGTVTSNPDGFAWQGCFFSCGRPFQRFRRNQPETRT